MGRVVSVAAADPVDWFELAERTIGCYAPHCLALAECLFDGVPYCLDCADLVLDRLVAVQLTPRLRELMPPVFER